MMNNTTRVLTNKSDYETLIFKHAGYSVSVPEYKWALDEFLLQLCWFPPTVRWTGDSKLPEGMNECLHCTFESL